jgi:hypothetical protein
MQQVFEFDQSSVGTTVRHKAAGHPHGAGGNMDLQKLCAYNQTRECFLGLEVSLADFTYADLKERADSLHLKSGQGLWLNPFIGLPEVGLRVVLDLVYLDEDCRVTEVIESVPSFHVNAAATHPVSVLALPAHSIYFSQTQPGDQLVVCRAEEMEQRLAQLNNSGSVPRSTAPSTVVHSAALLRKNPLWSGGPGLLELEDRSGEESPVQEKPHVMGLIQPGMKTVKPPKTWLERWWSPDPRKAPREPSDSLAAYYWTGGPTQPHPIRDVSATGLYVVTEERWYPGTLVLMTLQIMNGVEEREERSITVHSRAVRWGNDGVGLQFVLARNQDVRNQAGQISQAADRKELERFLQRLRKSRQ